MTWIPHFKELDIPYFPTDSRNSISQPLFFPMSVAMWSYSKVLTDLLGYVDSEYLTTVVVMPGSPESGNNFIWHCGSCASQPREWSHISRKVGWGMQSLWVTCTQLQDWLTGLEQVASSFPAIYLWSVYWCLFPLPCPSRCVEYLTYFPSLACFTCLRLSMLVPVFSSLMDHKHSS